MKEFLLFWYLRLNHDIVIVKLYIYNSIIIITICHRRLRLIKPQSGAIRTELLNIHNVMQRKNKITIHM